MTAGEIATMIDHTLLAPDATRVRIHELCDEAARYGFATVCVNGVWAREAAEALRGSDVKVCSVVAFPLGAAATAAKRAEAEIALDDGAAEIDMVLDVGGLLWGDDARVREDVEAVARAVHARGGLLKAILETGLLDERRIVRACEIALAGGADFVTTSTGFGPRGATVEDVRLMRATVGDACGVKASGGIRTLEEAVALVEAGATRLGTSRSLAIVGENSRG
jgi:deoxyribose-phosphate aldolase